jgi:hypothetical protein
MEGYQMLNNSAHRDMDMRVVYHGGIFQLANTFKFRYCYYNAENIP